MISIEQTLILSNRNRLLHQLETASGTLPQRMQHAVQDVAALGRLINNWVDKTAIQYRAAGMTIDEWYEDIQQWLQSNQFLIEEVEVIPQTDGSQMAIMHCHLSNEGIGKFVVIKFSLAR